ncbi:hypothetical protein PR257_02365 [Metamycoplasma hyosynoviae]|uniref:HinT-interacting membrane complex lipoprotein P60 n=1 Tax=Metamycoplasma hyosynoviae TaxID=29559 RepID=UPI0023595BB8|nr:hypothetical protein [Metamycoplasma hyosynoviae]MDC8921854.1 hypothetical protein [Metamycoplasma hyosynoviae]MDD7897856.1 hypothetical protein [Metamycoplasma hyosynoviae]
MKKNIFKKLTLLAAPIATVLPLALVATSCPKKSTESTETAGNQKIIINSQLSKNTVLQLITSVLLSQFYADDIKSSGINSNNKIDLINQVINKKDSALNKDFKEIFDVWALKKIDADKQYFSSLKETFQHSNIDTTNFNPGLFAIPNEEELKFIVTNSHVLTENISLEIQKLLLQKLFLLKDRPELKKVANNSKGEDKIEAEKKLPKDINVKEKEIHEKLDWKDDSINMLRELLFTPIVFSWEFTDKRDMNLRKSLGKIKNIQDFNRLAGYNPSETPQLDLNPVAKEWQKKIMIKSNMGIEFDKLRGYKGYKKSSDFTAGRDLSITIEDIKERKSVVYGYIEPNKNRIYSPESLIFNKVVRKVKYRALASLKNEIKTKFLSGELKTLTDKDFELKVYDGSSWHNTTQKEDAATKKVTFEYKLSGIDVKEYLTTLNSGGTVENRDYTLEFSIDKIKIDPEKTKDVEVNWNMNIQEISRRDVVKFDSKLTNAEGEQESNAKEFNTLEFPLELDIYKDSSKEFYGKYIMQVVPLLTKNKSGEEKFTFHSTPWGDVAESKKLALNLIFNSPDDYFKKAIQYFKELKLFEIDEKSSNLNDEIKNTLKQLGIL